MKTFEYEVKAKCKECGETKNIVVFVGQYGTRTIYCQNCTNSEVM